MLMKNYLLLLVASFGFTVLAVAQTSQPKKVIADKIVAVVGDKVILKSDIDNSIIDMQRQNIDVPENARCLMLEQAMGIKALVLQAQKDSLPVTDEEVETIIDNKIISAKTNNDSTKDFSFLAGSCAFVPTGFNGAIKPFTSLKKILENPYVTRSWPGQCATKLWKMYASHPKK